MVMKVRISRILSFIFNSFKDAHSLYIQYVFPLSHTFLRRLESITLEPLTNQSKVLFDNCLRECLNGEHHADVDLTLMSSFPW